MSKNVTKLSGRMKKEGRQHRMVWTTPQRFTRDTSKNINEITSPLTAGLFTKVPSKPTNHSKFTSSKVRGHAFNPAYKSKDKVKGTQKKRSSGLDVELINNGLLRYFSATACALYMEEEHDHYMDDRWH